MGPSTQANIGTDRVIFSGTARFTPSSIKERTVNVSAMIEDDMIALKDNEQINVGLTIDCPMGGVSIGDFPTTMVTIIDDDRKFYKTGVVLESSKACVCLGCLGLNAYFTKSKAKVSESIALVDMVTGSK